MKDQEWKKMKGEIKFKILNPGGNITAIVEGLNYDSNQKAEINNMIMKKYPKVEQVGFLSNDSIRLEMAGGEFCMNATRCAVYEYSKNNKANIEITVSGANKPLKGKMISDNEVEIILDISKSLNDLIEIKNDMAYVKIDGILIVVFNELKSKRYIELLDNDEENAKQELKQFMKDNIITNEKAIGLMFIERINDNIKINPVVWVKDIDTVFYETACGSGSLGTAIYNYYKTRNENISIIQPSGYKINIKLNIQDRIVKNAIITGVVEEG